MEVSTKIEIFEYYSLFYLVLKEELIRSIRTCASIFYKKYLESAYSTKRRQNYKLAVSGWPIENFIIVSSITKEVYSSTLCLWKKITLKVVLLTLYQQFKYQ